MIIIIIKLFTSYNSRILKKAINKEKKQYFSRNPTLLSKHIYSIFAQMIGGNE
jgi:hypothetical protein